jgi:hypothetical protein
MQRLRPTGARARIEAGAPTRLDGRARSLIDISPSSTGWWVRQGPYDRPGPQCGALGCDLRAELELTGSLYLCNAWEHHRFMEEGHMAVRQASGGDRVEHLLHDGALWGPISPEAFVAAAGPLPCLTFRCTEAALHWIGAVHNHYTSERWRDFACSEHARHTLADPALDTWVIATWTGERWADLDLPQGFSAPDPARVLAW